MNNDLYYWKYLKYKTKYLEEKNRIEGGGCDQELLNCKINEINSLQYFDNIISLMQSNDKNGIIDLLKRIYKKDVFSFLSYDKHCLAPELLKYLEVKQEELKKYANLNVSIPTQNLKGGAGSIATFPNLNFTSLNIKQNDDGTFVEQIIDDKSFSKGTAFLSKSVEKKKFISQTSYTKLERNLRYLANLMRIRFAIDANTFVESLRFGTPYAPKGATTFYDIQIGLLKKYVGKKKVVVISFLDWCDILACKLDSKIEEKNIIEKELMGYGEYVYLNLSCNNGVNLKSSISGISDPQLKKLVANNLEKLEIMMGFISTMTEIGQALEKLKGNFLDKLKKYVTDKDNIDPELLEQLKIRKFVLIKKPKNTTELTSFEDNMKQFSPCEEDLTNEHIGLVMFCYVSLVFYLLSKGKPNEFMLLYHCKSGQDRTGTFFAINQMVNQITTEHYGDIITKILAGTSFVDLFFEYYSLTKKIKNVPEELKFCPENPKQILQKNTNEDSKINTKVELCYLRYLLFSYLMTITSTGIPGIKWGLTNTNLPMKLFNKRKYDAGGALDNRYGYLLIRKPEDVLLFEGGSQQRGA